MPRRYRIAVIPGDGVGPEVITVAKTILDEIGVFDIEELSAGLAYYRRTGKPFQDDFLDRVRSVDAILKGPLATPPGPEGYQSITVLLRKTLDLYANIRPYKGYPGISPKTFNMVIVRENTEGLYAGIEGVHGDTAIAIRVVTRQGTERLARKTFEYALRSGFRRVTIVHKATVLKATDGLWLKVFQEIAKEYTNILVDDMLVDTAAYNMARTPEKLEVLATPNMYGDILSDVAAAQTGSLGLCASIQLGDKHALFEPVHGTAMDIAGKGIANPIAALKATTYMLSHLAEKHNDKKLAKTSKALDNAINKTIIKDKVLTPDIGGTAKTKDVLENVLKRLREQIG